MSKASRREFDSVSLCVDKQLNRKRSTEKEYGGPSSNVEKEKGSVPLYKFQKKWIVRNEERAFTSTCVSKRQHTVHYCSGSVVVIYGRNHLTGKSGRTDRTRPGVPDITSS